MALDLRQSENVISQLSAYYMIPYGIGALFYAPLARRFSVKWILSVAMAGYGIMSFLVAGIEAVLLMLLSRILMGLAAACVIPLCLISVGSLFEKGIRGRIVGLFFSTSFIASVAGIAVSGLCNWRWLYIVPGLLGLLASLLISLSGDRISKVSDEAPIDYLKVWRQDDVRNILLFIFVISFLYHGIHKWLAVYLHRQYDLKQWAISGFFILIALTGVVGQNLGGYLTDRIGRFIACYFGRLVLAGATMCLLGTYSPLGLWIILSLFSVGWAIGHNGISTVLTDFPDENRSEIASLNSAIRFFSGGLGFFVGGPFVERDISLTFFGFGVVMLSLSFFLKRIIPKFEFVKGEYNVAS